MMFCRLRSLLAPLLLISNGVTGFISNTPVANSSRLPQDIVTWDAHSYKVYNERLFLFSGEFHPFRLPVPGLWLDVFQKIKAMGFNGVSFYTDWALLEGQRGNVITEGIWSLQPFFKAASQAGIYLIARPGPYINAETAAGGMPGWTLRLNSTLRSDDPEYLNATKLYLQTLGKIIADAQITNGGPVILVQPENEYTTWPDVNASDFPEPFNRRYMAFVEEQLRESGVIVPLIFNDNEGSNGPTGYFAPGTGLGEVDIYGIDAYPMRYDCAHPAIWPTYRFPRYWNTWHEQVSPSTPFSIPEFQGGSGTGWGPDSVNQDMCNALVNEESVRVLFKNNYGFGVKLLNVYMTYGGTNWGNLGYQGGDTSYDYGAAITEDRHVYREKYSEQKLEANFLKVSPSFLTALPANTSNGSYVNTSAIATTPLFGTEDSTNFYVVRHADFTSLANTTYRLSVSTTYGNVTVPQLGGNLSLNGRDSKIHVTDYDIGGVNLIYCTADILTWAKADSGRRVLIMYGGANEAHEFALPDHVGKPSMSSGSSTKVEKRGPTWIVQWSVNPERQIVRFPHVNLDVYLLWRNEAYDHWVVELPLGGPGGNYSSPSKSHVIVKGGYLMRTAKVENKTLSLTGDLNCTTEIELLHEPTGSVDHILFNGVALKSSRNGHGNLYATAEFRPPTLHIPNLSKLEWRSIDSLPELPPSYDDTKWTSCNHITTTNPLLRLQTPTSLYTSDYGYHSGSLLYRGHFTATGNDISLFLNTSGGNAFAHSVFLNQTFLGSWTGNSSNQTYAQNFSLPLSLSPGAAYVLTVLIDHMGQDEEAPGTEAIKFPKGILSYAIHGAANMQTPVTWKMTGNLGGENYIDKARGPRNEGAMFAERQGYHLPAPPSNDWKISSPFSEGLDGPGVAFYSTAFKLDIPRGYDVPMSFVFNKGTYGAGLSAYRVQLFVNGYQFGKYVDNLGPQTAYPVPEGILNYEGINDVALTLWALEEKGASIGDLQLVPQMPVQSGYFAERIPLSPQPAWKKREGAY